MGVHFALAGDIGRRNCAAFGNGVVLCEGFVGAVSLFNIAGTDL